MIIELELPSKLEKLGDGIVAEHLKNSIVCIWNTILGCAFMGDIDNIEYLTNSAANIAEENMKICKRKLK